MPDVRRCRCPCRTDTDRRSRSPDRDTIVCPGTMPADKVDLRSEHRARTDLDVLLVEDRVRREADHAVGTERAEPRPRRVSGPIAPSSTALSQPPDHELAGRPLGTDAHAVRRSVSRHLGTFEHAARTARTSLRRLHGLDHRTSRGDDAMARLRRRSARSPTSPASASGTTSGSGAGGRPARRSSSHPAVRRPASTSAAAVRARGRPTPSRRENLVEQIHAVCLTGGSAYGLAAADGVMTWLEARGLGFPVGPPDAGPAPASFPSCRPRSSSISDGAASSRNRPDAGFGERAVAARPRAPSARGVPSAPAPAPGPAGCRVASAPRARRSGCPAGRRARADQHGRGHRRGARRRQRERLADRPVAPVCRGSRGRTRPATDRARPRDRRPLLVGRSTGRRRPDAGSLNTTIGVVATSARADQGRGRQADVGRPRRPGAGDPARAFDVRRRHDLRPGDRRRRPRRSPGSHALHAAAVRNGALNLLLAAAADMFAAACTHASSAPRSIGDAPSYFDLCPTRPRTAAMNAASACRR